MSYGKRVQLDSLFDPRQPMSTVQSLEIQLTPLINDDQDLVSNLVSCSRLEISDRDSDSSLQSKTIPSQFPETFTICFNLTREAVEMVRAGLSTRKRQPISPSKLPISHHPEQHYHDPNAKRIKTSQKSGLSSLFDRSNASSQVLRLFEGKSSTATPSLSLWRENSSNQEQQSSTSLTLFYSFLTDSKQCLATSYMSSKGHCCLCQFTAINNDLDVLIKHLSYCHPRFTASLKVPS